MNFADQCPREALGLGLVCCVVVWVVGALTWLFVNSEEKRTRPFLAAPYAGALNSPVGAESPRMRCWWLIDACKDAFDSAQFSMAYSLATELLSVGLETCPVHAYGDACHDANMVLGRLAVRRGEIDLALVHLAKSARCVSSPKLSTFGPNLSLARDLLEAGRASAVLDYLRSIGRLWEMDYGRLAAWILEIEEGKTPDFGGNLYR